MGILSKVEGCPTPPQVYNWRVYLTAAVASFAAMMIGYDSAFIGGTLALPSFINEFKWDAESKSTDEINLLKVNVVSLYQAGTFFAYPAGHYLGGQRESMIFSIVFIVGGRGRYNVRCEWRERIGLDIWRASVGWYGCWRGVESCTNL